MTKYILSIDKGSTNIKAVLFDLEGNEVATIIRRYGQMKQPHPGWNEQDMDRVWDVTRNTISEILKSGTDAKDIVSIGVTGQGNGLFLVDENGKPVRHAILSVDSRAQNILEGWIKEGIFERARSITGLAMYSATPCPLLKWLKENENQAYKKFRWLFFSKDWIKYKLTGKISTDPSDASGSTLMDISKDSYSEDIFDFCEISECKEKLPEIIPSMRVCGSVTKKASMETGLKEGTPVISGAHDIAASSYGAGGTEEGHLTIILGTLGLNLLVINDSRNGEIGDGVIRHTIPERWLALNCELSSGSSLEWFINTYCQDEIQESLTSEGSVYDIIEKKIETSSPSGLIYHPFINGRIDQNSARAGLYGLGAWHNKEDVIKAAYEGIAFAHCQIIDEDFSKTVEINSVSLVGGGARSSIWGQVFADILGQSVFIPGIEEITSRGVALCAGVGAGIYENLERANKVPLPLKKEYSPDNMTREERLTRYHLFKKIDTIMREIWDEMAEVSKR